MCSTPQRLRPVAFGWWLLLDTADTQTTGGVMNSDELTKAAALLGKVAEQFRALPVDQDGAAQTALLCEGARLALMELTLHLGAGLPAHEAVRRVAAGTTETGQSLEALAAKQPRNLGH